MRNGRWLRSIAKSAPARQRLHTRWPTRRRHPGAPGRTFGQNPANRTTTAAPSTPLMHTAEIELQVRDYECDMGQVVNNASYLNYLEHARHELLRALGIQFGELARRGIFLVVTHIEASFKGSLVSGDTFTVHTRLQRASRVRMQFEQTIRRAPDQKLMLDAVVTGTALNAKGRPDMPQDILAILT